MDPFVGRTDELVVDSDGLLEAGREIIGVRGRLTVDRKDASSLFQPRRCGLVGEIVLDSEASEPQQPESDAAAH